MRENPDYQPPDLDFLKAARGEDFELKNGVISLKGAPDERWARVELGRFLRAIHFRQGGQMLAAEVFYDPPSELPDWQKWYGNMSAMFRNQPSEYRKAVSPL